MNVLMVLDSMASGGTETHVLSIAKKLKDLGIQVVIVGNPGSFETVYSRFFKTYLTDYDWSKAPEQEWIRKYKAIMTKERISLVHVHQTPSGLLAPLPRRSWGFRSCLPCMAPITPRVSSFGCYRKRVPLSV